MESPSTAACCTTVHASGRYHRSSHPVMAIPGCQFNYICNELQSRTGGLTCDPDQKYRRHKFWTWILAWKSWGMKNLHPDKVVHALIPEHWGKEISEFMVSLGQNKPQIPAWWCTPLVWNTPLTRDRHKNIGGRKIHSSLHACIYLSADLLEPTFTED